MKRRSKHAREMQEALREKNWGKAVRFLIEYEGKVVNVAIESGNCIPHAAAEEKRKGEAGAALACNVNINVKSSLE